MEKRIAIVSYAFRFPGTTQQNLWADLLSKKILISKVDPSRWAQEYFLHPDKRHPGTSYTFSAGSLGDIFGFDAGFFGISPREAAQMDPQQKMLLELAWETFENAGIVPSTLKGSDCGVFIGLSSIDSGYRFADDLASLESSTATGILPSIAANRLSYIYDLHGPSVAVDTACSSALVAFHQACQAIRSGEISQALTGGINLHLHPYGFISFSKATMLSKTGRCHVFDESADGYVRSEGGGLFLLKNYQQAVADGDHILALVSGSMVNTDGHKSGLTIPSTDVQAELLDRVYKKAGIDPNDIDYLEAHGTGTPVGDPIETYAIGLGLAQKRKTALPIGSIKSNLGHLESASGVAGLVKALNCIKHRQIPPTAGIEKINPNIRCKEWNLAIPTEPLSLKAHGRLIVGVNSFGFGGANAHVILESHNSISPISRNSIVRLDRHPLPLIISAKDRKGLVQAADNMAEFLEQLPDTAFYNTAYSSFFSRERHSQCTLVFSNSPKEAAALLQDFIDVQSGVESPVCTAKKLSNAKGPVFVYSGNGCQWETMGKTLLEQSQTFRRTVGEIDRLFSKYASFSLLDELAGANGKDRFQQTEISQPALFALQVGLTEVLRENGVNPLAVIGHSVGEVAAAWACGILSLPSAVKVIYYRSHHQGLTRGKGQMTAVGLGLEDAESLLVDLKLDQVCIAGDNSAKGVTIAGNIEQLSLMERELESKNLFFRRLDLDYAFHSQTMDTIKLGLVADLGNLSPGHMKIPFYSTVHGELLRDQKLDADYWWHNVRKPVQFRAGMDALTANGFNMFIEIGAHPVLRSYLQDALKVGSMEGMVVPTLSRNKDSLAELMKAVSLTLLSGADVNIQRWFPVKGEFVMMPNYPWQREKFTQPVTSESYGFLFREKIHPLLGYVLKQQDHSWENQLDTLLQPYLADHNVGGAVVFPGAGFVEMAIAAAHAYGGENEFIELEDVEIHLPLLLTEDNSKVIRTEIKTTGGQFIVRSRNLASGTEWSQHISGRIVPAPTGNKLALKMPVLPKRPHDFDLAAHNRLTEWTGLQYGNSFKTIASGWSDAVTAIGRFHTPESFTTDLDRYFLHPGFLDCAFQLIFQVLKDEVFKHEGIAFVPVKFGRIHIATRKSVPHVAKARIVKRSPHSLNTEFAIFDHDGKAIALLSDVRFKAVRLHKQNAQSPDYLDYHLTPSPLAGQQSLPRLTTEQLSGLFDQLDSNQKAQLFGARYGNEVEPLLDSLSLQFITEALAKFTDGHGLLKRTFINNLEIFDFEMMKSFKNIIDIAVTNHMLTPEQDSGWRLDTRLLEKDLSAQGIWRALIQEYPDFFYLINLTGRTGIHLEEILRGKISAEKIDLHPKLYDRITYQLIEQTSKRTLLQLLQTYCDHALTHLAKGQRLSILEVSAYKPIFASALCQQIDFRLCDYRFASFCGDALTHAELLREHFPLMQTLALSEGYPTNGITGKLRANLAIISLNSVDLKEIKSILAQLPNMLDPGSPIVLIGQHPAQWLDIILGTSKSWWLQDEDNEFISPQLSADQVEEQLQALGFDHTRILDSGSGGISGLYIITANNTLSGQVSDNEKPSENWLLIDQPGNPSALATAIAEQLREKGHRTKIIGTEQEDAVAMALTKAKASSEQYDHIIHLSGFGSHLPESQIQRCALASDIVRGCESTATQATIWLFTHQTGRLFASDQGELSPVEYDKCAIANDAALWGFGRSLINEASNYNVKLLDVNGNLDTLATPGALLDAILAELLNANDEQEVILSADGARYAPRLRIETDPLKIEIKPTGQRQRLGFKLPGQLRNLSWDYCEQDALSDESVEIEVKATGLNFRDVMYTLGLLSDEAVENGFVGPSLGLEFAGIVIAKGANVSQFAVGDPVFGFAPACFSNRLTTQADAIAPIPANIDFVAAATIPSTFFTAYYALVEQARLQAGEKILIHGAAGGVGIAAVQIAQWLDAEIFATAGSVEKRDFLKLMGVEHIHDSRSLNFAEEILGITKGKGIDVVLNSIAGEAINRNFQVLKPFGRFLELGKRDFYENTHIGLRPFRNNISYFGIDADQLMLERPELTQRLFVEMMALFRDGILYPLPYTVFDANQVVDAFRHMQQAKQIGKIVVTYDNGIKSRPVFVKTAWPPLQLSPEGTYLVTGGLSGFGLKTAQWLVDKGAKHLVLLSRSGALSDENTTVLTTLEKSGVKILRRACDVADKAALKTVFDEISARMPPLKGIVHSATVIEDGLAKNTDREQIERVLSPKIFGAAHLHELTSTMALDFFILYSSATTLFGNPGQSSYVAANLWLEALAAHRVQVGLPATCIRWGAIGDVGYLARNEKVKDALQSRMGGSLLNSDNALAIMEAVIAANRPTLGVMELDWPALARFLPSAASPKFHEIALHRQDNEQHHDASANIQQLLEEKTDDELKIVFIDMLKQELAQILLLSVDKIDENQSVYDMGMDSLMGVELMVAIESRFGTQIPVMMLSEASSLNKLVEKLIEQLRGKEASKQQATASSESAALALASKHGSDFTSDQIAAVSQQLNQDPTPTRIVH